jgi:AcrR family transcriptional regulator
VTLAEVGRQAGYSSGLASHHFGTKANLIAAVAEHMVQAGQSAERRGDDILSGADALKQFVYRSYTDITSGPAMVHAYFAIVTSFSEDATVHLALRRTHRSTLTYLTETVERGIADGSIQSTLSARELAIAVLAMLRGIAWESYMDVHAPLSLRRGAILKAVQRLIGQS